jgi:Flp pilus assembly protein TadG
MQEGAHHWFRKGRELPPARRALGAKLVREQGQAVVEFALVLPVLALLLFGMIDFARALNYYNTLTQLAGQGARAAAVYGNPDGGPVTASSIQCQLIRSYTTSAELKSGISVNVSAVPAQVGDPVQLTASYTFNFIPLVKSATLSLTATSAHRAEVFPSTGFAPTGSYTDASCP